MTANPNDISKKFLTAKRGDLFHTTMADTTRLPLLLIFQELKDGKVHFKAAVPQCLEKDESVDLWVDADDRYGHYPRITSAQLEKFQARCTELQKEMLRYASILAQYYDSNNEKAEFDALDKAVRMSVEATLPPNRKKLVWAGSR